ncbi:Dehydration-responsive element-binding protein 1B [Euphorbia peplus]|nr:Dehydration-responsive element-binding protein 1B [Euphorbia peplus]
MAARAHDVAVLALKGRSACLNFADSWWRLPVPDSGHAKDIQKAAAEAGRAFGPVGKEEIKVKDTEDITRGSEETTTDNVFYMDEEMVFRMPGLLLNMAQGMLLPPPNNTHFVSEDNTFQTWPDLPLWNF